MLALVLTMLAVLVIPGTASAASRNCWGVVVSQRAVAVGDIGAHSSAQEEPRAGVGNLDNIFGFAHIADVGAFLASVDGIDATNCS